MTTTPTLICATCSLDAKGCCCVCKCGCDLNALPPAACLDCAEMAAKDAQCPGCGEEREVGAVTCGSAGCIREVRA